MKKQSNIIALTITLLGIIFFMTDGYAANKEDSFSDSEKNAQQEQISTKLNDIRGNIKLLRSNIVRQSNLLKAAETEQEKKDIQLRMNEIRNAIAGEEKSFELIQTGGLELAKVEASQEKQFDWQKDLLEILQPIMKELRQLTEDKRKLANLQNKISFYQHQIPEINKALEQMERIDKNGLKKDALEYFEQINKKWKSLLDENNHLIGVAQLQLDGMIKAQEEQKISVGSYLAEFAIGRGTTLLMAVVAFFIVFFFMKLIWKGIMHVYTLRRSGRRSYFIRVSSIVYHITMFVFSMIAVIYVLNARNDQILVGLVVLLLVILVLALRNSIPNYINQIQIVVNAGSIREGEHVIYNGIPMIVEDLSLYTKLTNPALPYLTIRLPLSKLSEYVSRKYSPDEPWFPCQKDDFVLLSDGTYGKVKCITLENIIISFYNGMSPKTYSISDFLAANPTNLSEGFFATSEFGIDYKYQKECTTQVPELLCAGIKKGLLQESYADSLKDIGVNFSQANSSSLDYKIIAVFDGRAARDYYAIIRAIQRYAVEVCNQQKWEIPFNRLAVHINKTE